MSIVEQIKEIQRAQEEEAARKRQQVDTERQRKEKEAETREMIRKVRESFVAEETRRILKESGVLDTFLSIEAEILDGNYKHHDIIFNPHKAKAILAWSVYDLDINNGQINGDEYSFVTVEVNPDTKKLTIRGRREYVFDQSMWIDKKSVERSLALAFTDPGKYEYHHNDTQPDECVNGQDSG